MFNLLFLEGAMGDIGTLILLVVVGLFGVPLLLATIGLIVWFRKKKKTTKVLWLTSVIYFIIGLGICKNMA